MTIAQVKTMLESIEGFENKVSYFAFPVGEAPQLPFICFLETGTNNFSADGIVYQDIHRVQIELYSIQRDLVSEALIDDKLTENTIYFNKSIVYLDDEKCYEVIYEIEV